MEKLTILTTDAKALLSRDLAAEKGPVLVIADASAGVRLAASAAAGDQVLGALVRGEDGWTLASSVPGVDVASGPKRASALPLFEGTSLALGDYVFTLEGESAQTGSVLVWRVGRSPVAADSILAGRNVVALDPATEHAVVNPPIQGATLFEFYPSAESLEVVSRSGEPQSVPFGVPFGVGDFRAMVLSRADATAAMRTRNPFAWPARHARRRVFLGVAVLLAVAAFAGVLGKRAAALERRVAEQAGSARLTTLSGLEQKDAVNDEDYLFTLAFYRDLPLALQAKPSPISRDLIVRAAAFPDNATVQEMKAFLETAVRLQEAVAANRWDALSETLKSLSRADFVHYGAADFYDDVEEVSRLVSKTVPDAIARASVFGQTDYDAVQDQIDKLIEGLSDNRFAEVSTLEVLMHDIQSRLKALDEYVDARDLLFGAFGKPPVETTDLVSSVAGALASLESLLNEGALIDIVAREKAFVRARLARLAANPKLLVSVIDLASVAEADEAQLAAWRTAARARQKAIDERVRALYREYRGKAHGDAVRSQAILAEIIGEADPKNPFRAWAEREKARREKK